MYAPLWGILVALVLILGCKGDKIEDIILIPDVASSSRIGRCKLIISGRVVNTKNLQPIKDAIITSDLFITETDSDGNFRVALEISKIEDPDFLTVTRRGYLPQTIPIFYDSVLDLNDCPYITNIDWKIGLSAQRECVIVGKDEGAWFKIMDTVANEIINEFGLLDTVLSATIYAVDVRRRSLEEYVNLCISPDNSFAYGPGILINHSLFRLVNFVIEDANNPGVEVKFLKPLEIIFSNINPNNSFGTIIPVLDLDNLTIDELGRAQVISNNKNLLRLYSSGNVFLGDYPDVVEFCRELLDRDIETIRRLIRKFRDTPDSPTRIASMETKSERIIKQETFSNCECAQPNQATYNVEFNGEETINIDFPSGTSKAIQAQVVTKLRTLLADSGQSLLKADLKVNLDKCSQVTVISRPITECTTGVIDGYPFTYEATKKLETIIQTADRCAVETGCHQGCTG